MDYDRQVSQQTTYGRYAQLQEVASTSSGIKGPCTTYAAEIQLTISLAHVCVQA